VLVGVLGNQPVYSASDVGFGGRPSVTGNGVKAMVSATPASAIVVAQPGSIIFIARNQIPVFAADEIMQDGSGGAGGRWYMWKGSGNSDYRITTGVTAASTGINIIAAERNLITTHYNGASSYFRKRTAGGAIAATGALNAGVASIQGLSLFGKYNHLGNVPFGVTAVMVVTGLSAADQAQLDAWCQVAMGWT
jgi:hypothetical protein